MVKEYGEPMRPPQWPYADETPPGALLDLDIAEDMEREFSPQRKEQTMAYANQTMDANISYEKAQGGSVGVVKETPFTRLDGAVERLRKAHAIVDSVSSNLLGNESIETRDRVKRPPVGSGLLGSVEELADAVSDMADDIAECASRIQSRL